jgi:mannose-6-phosphate isomerase-like protein (cupin superfamily)
MLADKVNIQELPIGGDDHSERRFFSGKGEMAQILNHADSAFKLLVYWDLDSARTGQERGHHYHEKKREYFYILSGEIELCVEDIETSEQKTFIVKAGSRLTISNRVAHAFRSLDYSQVLEYSPEPYDPSDTYPYTVFANKP